MLIHFSDLEDEQTVSEENISINGTFDDEEIANITL
jgi:hypothetical protein